MLSIPKTAAFVALGAVIGLGAMTAGSAPAKAFVYRTECLGNECFRERCDDDGYQCERISYVDRDRYRYDRNYRYVCDEDGYNCRYERVYNNGGFYDEYGDWHPY